MNFSARYLTDPKFKALLAVARLDKPVGTLLLLWPTLAALWIAAEGWPGWHLLLVFVLGTFLTRSAGCVVNDIADRKFDPFVERTQDRPLAQGVITVRAALLWMGVLLGLAAILVLTTNVLTIMLAAVGACFAGLYPFMKRITHLPQLVLGLAFSMGIPMAFTAVTGALSEAAGLLFLANLVWVVAYDTEYAMVDRAEDLLIGVKSTGDFIWRSGSIHHWGITSAFCIATLASRWPPRLQRRVPRPACRHCQPFVLSAVSDPRSKPRGQLCRL
jgi:4-hydroxybenzoate polyprenyltransferase